MFDRGLNLTLQAVRRQIAVMPHNLYLIRLIHHQTRRAFPGERLWTAASWHPTTLRFLRVRNREGCDANRMASPHGSASKFADSTRLRKEPASDGTEQHSSAQLG